MQNLRLTQDLVQSLRQEQILAPQQIQALEILLATIPELEQKITQELEENPTLEMVGSGMEDLIGNPVEDKTGSGGRDEDEGAAAAEKDETLATLIELTESWRDYTADSRRTMGPVTEEDLERRQFLFDSLTAEASLQDVLLGQLRLTEGLDDKLRHICEQVIGSIDDRGYLRTHPADIAITADADPTEVKEALAIVQGFEPPGIGARDLRECLLLQLERKGQKGTAVYEAVDKHLEDIGRNQIPKVARALRVSTSGFYDILRQIRKLNPFPGSVLAPGETNVVMPEVFVEKDLNGQWQVRSNREYSPRLRISPYYLQLLKRPDTPADVKSYIREKMTSSKLLLRAIAQRRSTIERIALSLLKLQNDFFVQGVAAMHPLVMSQVADDIGLHETTVSRAIANKYVQTPHGLFPFKHFFSSGYEGSDGEKVSSLTIKKKIQGLLRDEDAKCPLSDQKLAAMLKAQGFKVARRTVAKYREEAGILPSHMRRNY